MSSLIQRTTARNRRVTGHIFGRDELDWHGNVLQLGRGKLAQIEPDAVWPSMWRVRTPDGRLTEMVNISRARDAARAQETPAGAPPIARNQTPFAECGMSTPRAAKRLRRTTVEAMIVAVEG
jgi:hypothetical protein